MAILYVDDDSGLAATAQRILESKIEEVILAYDGQEGLDAFAQHNSKISLILTDNIMPVMDGLKFLQTLQERYSPEQLPPRLMLSAGGKDALRNLYKAVTLVGASGLMEKPYEVRELLVVIRELKEGKHSPALDNYHLQRRWT